MNIRIALETDLDAIHHCIEEAYEGYISRISIRPASMDRTYLPLVQANCVYVCESEREIEGMMVITEHTNQIEVSSVAVRPRSQGKGLGRYLMKEAEAIAVSRGFGKLTLYTNAALPELSSYYESLGYKSIDRRLDEGFDRVFFEKELASDA